ncbi:MAG: RNA recognition motif domain-containing protein [Gemmataceae bacterium]
MSKSIYVGNLSFETTDADLETAFAQFGPVTRAQVAMDRGTGRSRGFGFVEMSQGGDEAIAEMNGTKMNGRTLVINEAKARDPRPMANNHGAARSV